MKKASNIKEELEKGYDTASDPLEPAGETMNGSSADQKTGSVDRKAAGKWFRNLLVPVSYTHLHV